MSNCLFDSYVVSDVHQYLQHNFETLVDVEKIEIFFYESVKWNVWIG